MKQLFQGSLLFKGLKVSEGLQVLKLVSSHRAWKTHDTLCCDTAALHRQPFGV